MNMCAIFVLKIVGAKKCSHLTQIYCDDCDCEQKFPQCSVKITAANNIWHNRFCQLWRLTTFSTINCDGTSG